MSDYRPVKGDRVRIVVEDLVLEGADSEGTFETKNNWFEGTEGHVVSVEKIEPPATVFKPGDVVRNLATGNRYALGATHSMSLQNGRLYKYGDGGNPQPHYNSKNYELVDLSK